VRGQGDVLIIALSEAERAATDDRTMQQSVEIVRRRVDEAGTREPTIQRQGADRILIQVPGIGSAQELKELIGTTARLTFQPVVGRATAPMRRPGRASRSCLPWTRKGCSTSSNDAGRDGRRPDGQPAEFRPADRAAGGDVPVQPDGRAAFGEYTAANVGAPFAIVLDDEVISAPVIRQAITGGSGQISGNFTVESSTELAVLLRAGALPAEMTFLEERTIGPELGADSIAAGELAALVAFVAVLVFMILSYGLFGVFASVALILNVGLIFGVLSLIGATLTLPGIAGIVLTIGMAVDANVLVFERIREE
jgi:preprotein translocase subunit SecD